MIRIPGSKNSWRRNKAKVPSYSIRSDGYAGLENLRLRQRLGLLPDHCLLLKVGPDLLRGFRLTRYYVVSQYFSC